MVSLFNLKNGKILKNTIFPISNILQRKKIDENKENNEKNQLKKKRIDQMKSIKECDLKNEIKKRNKTTHLNTLIWIYQKEIF